MNLVVTGSSSGIGKFLAESFAAHGHEVCRIARSAQPGFSFRCDVSDFSELENCAGEVSRKWDHVDGLICCAGVQEPIGPAMKIDPVAWRKTLAINLDGTFFSIRAFFPLLKKSARAKVICFSGGGSTSPRPNFAAYGVSKTGVVRLVETLAVEWNDQPFDINAIAPGAIFTKMTEEVLARGEKFSGEKEFGSATEMSREENSTKLEKVLGLVEFLLSEKSNGISGKLISAPWDPWMQLNKHRDELASSDIYTLRRIVPEDRGKNWSL